LSGGTFNQNGRSEIGRYLNGLRRSSFCLLCKPLWVIGWGNEIEDRIVFDADHNAAIDGCFRLPGFQWNVLDELWRNWPEGFGDDLEVGALREMFVALVDA
jgi:hypothetical protein